MNLLPLTKNTRTRVALLEDVARMVKAHGLRVIEAKRKQPWPVVGKYVESPEADVRGAALLVLEEAQVHLRYGIVWCGVVWCGVV